MAHSALPHLLQRLRRRLALWGLACRVRQINTTISQVEQAIVNDHDYLAALRTELHTVSTRLRHTLATAPRRAPRSPWHPHED